MSEISYAKGLEGVIAAESIICKIDGLQGKLFYRGYSIDDLAEHSNFEEITYLLLYEKLPSNDELLSFQKKMRSSRDLPKPVLEMIQSFPENGKLMELLQSVISYLSGTVGHTIQHSATCSCKQTLHQIAQIPSVIAAYDRFRNGNNYIPPREDLSHGANFLYMLHGKEPTEREGNIMDVTMLLHAEHGFNASTFTARVVASTISTCYASISAAIGALYGILHGGANEKVMAMLDEIGTIENVESYVDSALENKKKIMGMGHRVYKAKDPRAVIIEKELDKLCKEKSDSNTYEFLKKIETYFGKKMKETGKDIYPNVDFFSGAVYTHLGIARDLYTPLFAASRAPGWLAHILEQRKDNRLFRPKALYRGPEPQNYIPVSDR
jgi:citrate synthase